MADLRQLARAERRRKRRFTTPGLAALHGKEPLEILDVSLTGIGLATRRPHRPGERLQLRVCASPTPFTITGRVTWIRCDGTFRNAMGEVEPHYRAGLRFDPLHPRDAQHLLDLLDRLASGTRSTPAEPTQQPAPPAEMDLPPAAE